MLCDQFTVSKLLPLCTHSPPRYLLPCTAWLLGIGLALAREFLAAGDNVFICSRSGMELW